MTDAPDQLPSPAMRGEGTADDGAGVSSREPRTEQAAPKTGARSGAKSAASGAAGAKAGTTGTSGAGARKTTATGSRAAGSRSAGANPASSGAPKQAAPETGSSSTPRSSGARATGGPRARTRTAAEISADAAAADTDSASSAPRTTSRTSTAGRGSKAEAGGPKKAAPRSGSRRVSVPTVHAAVPDEPMRADEPEPSAEAVRSAAPAPAAEPVDDVLVVTTPDEITPAIGEPEEAPAVREPALAEAPLAEAPLAEVPLEEAPVGEAPVGEAVLGGAPVGAAVVREAPLDESRTSERHYTAPLTVQSAPVSPRPMPKRRPVRPDAPARELGDVVLSIEGLSKRFGETVAVENLDLAVREGSFYGIVGPNGAGKTTTLSMITGLLRPDAGRVTVHDIDVWGDPVRAKRAIGVLPDTLRLFDRLTGAQLLYYSGTLRGLDHDTVRTRSADLVKAFGIEDAVDRLVTDYSAGMTKKIALAAAMIHSPRLLVLDEPFESVDPVSAANLNEILQKYVAAGGTVVLSSHGMDFIQRVCDHVAIIVAGRVLSAGTMDEVRGENTLEERFVELAGGRKAAEGMEWLHSFTD